MPSLSSADRRAVWIVFALVSAALTFVVAPDVGWYDAGELSASLFTAGISHPTGFPLYHPLGKLATLLPVGSVAFRVNLLSALFAGGTIAALTGLLLALVRKPEEPGGRDWLPAAAGAAGLLAARTFWLHSVSVEVYVINGLALALFLFGLLPLLRGDRTADERLAMTRRVLPLLAFGFGLGLGSHVTFPLVAGAATLPLLWLLLREPGARRWLLVRVPWLLVLVVLGALVIAYLPLAAGREPFRNWGDPSTLERLVEHLTGARIRRMFAGEMSRWSWTSLAAHAGQYLELAWSNLGPLLFASAAGVVWLARRHRALLAATLLALLADAAFTIKLNPMGMAELQTSIPSYLVLVLWAGLAALWGARLLAAHFPARPALSAAMVCLPLVGLWTPLYLDAEAERDFSGAGEAAALARIGMDLAPPGAVWITSSDSLCSLTAHLQAVENHRPDLRALVKQNLWDPLYVRKRTHEEMGAVIPPAVAEQQAQIVAEGRAFDPGAQTGLLVDIVKAHRAAGAPVCFEPGDGALDGPFLSHLSPGFPLWRFDETRPPSQGGLAALERQTARSLRLWGEGSAGLDTGSGRLALAHWLRIAAADYARDGDNDTAQSLLEWAGRLAPREPRVLNNLGVLRSRQGDLPGAVAAAEAAVAASADYRSGWYNLGSFRAAGGDLEGAYDAFAAAVELGTTPRYQFRVAFDLGRLHAQRGETLLAAFWLDRALELQPGHAEALRWRGELR